MVDAPGSTGTRPTHFAADPQTRSLPLLTPDNRHFWTGGERGELQLLHCQDCGFWIHPGGPICTRCHSRSIAPEATSGSGSVYSYTVNRQPWTATWPVPYVIAIVELDDQPRLRLTTNIDAPIEEVAIGMPVTVCFERVGELFLPYFVPSGLAA